MDHFGQNPSTVYLERFLGRETDPHPSSHREREMPGTQNPEPRTQNPPQDSGLRTQDSTNGICRPATERLRPLDAYLPVVAREGQGTSSSSSGLKALLSGWLPRLAISRELFPYRGAPRIWEADQVGNGGCNLCFNSCTTRYYLKQGRVIAITGNPDDPVLQGRICPKAQMQIQQFFSPHRLTYPMKRVGKRGEGKFRRIGWDEALDEVAEKLKEVRNRYGPEALGIYTGNRNGTLTVLGAATLFGDMFGTPNREGSASLCSTSRISPGPFCRDQSVAALIYAG